MSGKSHPPSPRRLREARRRGDVAVSRVATGLCAAVAGLGALVASLPDLAREEALALRRALAEAVGTPDPPSLALLNDALLRAGRLAAPTAAAALGAALLCGVAQSGGLLAPGAARARWERLDPFAGARRLLSPPALGTAALQSAQGLALALLGAVLLADRSGVLVHLPRLSAPAAWFQGARAVGCVAVVLLAASGVLAVADLLRVRHRHLQALRMSRAEIERDLREDEGDPRLRAERRRLHASLSAGPARPACVVVNPTRLAVVLAWPRDRDGAPLVLGKGSGRIARALRREARRLGIPVVHDRPLARALFQLAEVGEAIPEELYAATAAVLAWLRQVDAEISR